MSVIRWNPTRELSWPSDLSNMQREINRLFDSFFHGNMKDDRTSGLSSWIPAVDISEQGNHYVVKMELPGVNKDDVKITVESNVLTIRGEKKQEKDVKEENYQRIERSYGSFQRSFTLPGTVRNDAIDAIFKEGVLTVTVPKAEDSKAKHIEVKVK